MDLDVRLNHTYLQRKQPQKVLEGSRGLHTEAKGEALAKPASQQAPRAHMLAPVVMSVLHRLLDCIYAIYSSRFDSRAQD